MVLAEKPERLNSLITCPYHSWAFDMDGNLRATPHVRDSDIHDHVEMSNDSLSLNEIRSVIWRTVIYVNLLGSTPTFNDLAADLKKRWAEFETPLYFSGEDSLFSLTVNCT